MLDLIINAIGPASFALVFLHHFAIPGGIAEFYAYWLQRIDEKGLHRLAKPLGYCHACFSGQVCLWWYLLQYRADLSAHGLIVFVCVGMVEFQIIKKLIE